MSVTRFTAAEAAAISVNVSLKTPIEAATLVGIFKGTHAPGAWMPHLAVFFSDVPDAILKKFMAQNHLSASDMLRIFHLLSPAMQHKHFLEVVYGRVEEAV